MLTSTNTPTLRFAASLPQHLAQPCRAKLVHLRALRPRGLAAEVEHEVPLSSGDVRVVEDAREGRFAEASAWTKWAESQQSLNSGARWASWGMTLSTMR